MTRTSEATIQCSMPLSQTESIFIRAYRPRVALAVSLQRHWLNTEGVDEEQWRRRKRRWRRRGRKRMRKNGEREEEEEEKEEEEEEMKGLGVEKDR